MSFYHILFPAESRTFPGKRWANVICRSFHLCGAAVYTGGLFYADTEGIAGDWYILTVFSGLLMMGADIYGNGKYIFQNRGFLILIKFLLLGALFHTGTGNKWIMLILIFLSGVVSHAPARFRYYSLYHRREI